MRRRAPLAVRALAFAAGTGGSWMAADATSVQARAADTSAPQVTATPRVAPGDTLILHGKGFPRRVHVTVLVGAQQSDARPIGGARTGRRGSFVATIRIRDAAAAGSFVVLVCHDACRVKASARFRIAAP